MKKLKIKKILVSQNQPENEKNPYSDLAERYKLDIDFLPFVKIEGVSAKEFRKNKVNIAEHTAIIFLSRTAIDHFFRICNELRIDISETLKYFCISESVALYLQKYTLYRKRRIFFANNKTEELIDIILKNPNEKYLFPISDSPKHDIPKILQKNKIRCTKAAFYKTTFSDLKNISCNQYDILVFFSPSGVKSLIRNFPNFKQRNIKIASFGSTTAKAAIEAGLRIDIQAPAPQAPSMTMALEQYIQKCIKEK